MSVVNYFIEWHSTCGEKRDMRLYTQWMILIFLMFFNQIGHAQSRNRVEISESKLMNLVGVVKQNIDSKFAGNGFFVDKLGCYVLSNFHVVFGTGKEVNGNIIIHDNPAVGHTIIFSYDFDAAGRVFRRNSTATVIDFGNYEAGSTRGFLGDWALIKLEHCAGKNFSGLNFTKLSSKVRLPTGPLHSISVELATKPLRILEEDGCYSEPGTPVAGMLPSSCTIVDGMSGSMLLERDVNNRWHIAGMMTKGSQYNDGTSVSLAISASVLRPAIAALIPLDEN